MTRPRCYVASPLGFNDAGRWYYEHVYLRDLGEVADLVDPWSFLGPEDVESAREAGTLRELWLRVGQRNLDQIRSADVLVAWLDGQEVDSGTAIEIGYAAALGTPCIGLRTDLRLAGEEGMAVNLQVEATIVASGGRIVSTLPALVDELARHAGTGRTR